MRRFVCSAIPGVEGVLALYYQHRPKPVFCAGMVVNPRKGTARHEYFFSWLLLETAVGGRKVITRGGLFDVRPKRKGINEEA